MTRDLEDPWEGFHIEDSCKEEKCLRHMYNPREKTWRKDTIVVRMQDKVWYFAAVSPITSSV